MNSLAEKTNGTPKDSFPIVFYSEDFSRNALTRMGIAGSIKNKKV